MNIAEIIVGIAGIVGGAKALKKGFGDGEPTPVSRELGRVMSVTPFKTRVYDVKSIDQRVRRCVELIQKSRYNPHVRAFASKAVSARCGSNWCVAEKDYLGEIEAVYQAVRKSMRYVRDPEKMDLFQHPLRSLEFASGDCDDFSIVIAALLQSIGFPVRLRVIRTKGSGDWNHIYNMVGVPPRRPTRWVPVDASVGFGSDWEAPKDMVADKRDFRIP